MPEIRSVAGGVGIRREKMVNRKLNHELSLELQNPFRNGLWLAYVGREALHLTRGMLLA